MKTTGTCCHPDFARNSMPIDNNLAAIGKFDLENTSGNQFKIDLGRTTLKSILNPRQSGIGNLVEFLVFHRVLPFLFC